MTLGRARKWRFRRRAVSANATLVPVFGTGGHAHVPLFWFLVPGEHPNVPHSGFWYRGNILVFGTGGTSAKTTILETILL